MVSSATSAADISLGSSLVSAGSMAARTFSQRRLPSLIGVCASASLASGQLCSSDFFYRSQRWSFSYSGSRSIDSGHARRHTKVSIALLGVARAGYDARASFNGLGPPRATHSPDAPDRSPSQHALQIPLSRKTELTRGRS